jgi:beta-galactosidase
VCESTTLNFNPGWKIASGSYSTAGIDDSHWENISTPHTYHENEAFFGLAKGTKDLGSYTYRKHFKLPIEYENQEILLEFEGIRQRGTFYLNGHLLGRHDDGVTPFGFDITKLLNLEGADNVLQVEIDCGDIDRATGTKMSWFFPGFNPLYGGICRNVKLHVLGKIHSTLPLYSALGTTGTYIYAENISTQNMSADVGFESEVKNDSDSPAKVDLEAVVVDRSGIPVATLKAASADVGPGDVHTFTAKMRVEGLHFWQPGYPYLYDVYTIVSSQDRVLDVQKINTGFRKIEIRGSTLYLIPIGFMIIPTN